jgi:ABC-type antimicrobial peptide transport system ATPase subunit
MMKTTDFRDRDNRAGVGVVGFRAVQDSLSEVPSESVSDDSNRHKLAFSSCSAARLFIADETTTNIIVIRSNVQRGSLWNVCNPHYLN